jgi:uncharacterized membrane protein YcaP (DUF421 family)
MIIIQSGNISLDIFKKKKAEAQEIKREKRERSIMDIKVIIISPSTSARSC